MTKPPRYPTITPMRALAMLERIHQCRGGKLDHSLLGDISDALSRHVKAALVRSRRRKAKARKP